MDKNQYFQCLKQLHDICRNNPAPKLTGLDAYNEIINFLYLRHLSDNDDDVNPTIEKQYNLRTLYEEYCLDKDIKEDKENENYNNINKSGAEKKLIKYEILSEKLLPGLLDQKRNENIAFMKIMGDNIKDLKVDIGRLTNIMYKEEGTSMSCGGQKAQKLINKIYDDGFLPTDENDKFNLNLFPYDALGEGFEKFMSDAGSSGGNWGQYFTNGQVIDWILKKIKLTEKSVICDPFAGSGGFILRAKNECSKLKSENIYAHEFDDRIFKFLKFNSNIAGLKKDNIIKGDSYDYRNYIKNNLNKFDFILTNPPYGESVDIDLSNDTDKNTFWGIMKSGKKTIKNSMGLSVYAIIQMLKDGGTTSFVTERGIMNNGTDGKKLTWEGKLRKYMIETCNITDILLLPKGIFAHTNFDTAVIMMTKGKQTTEIKFHQGYFKTEDKGKSNKTMHTTHNILTITFEMIVNKNWSFKYEDYIEKVDNGVNGILYKPLGDVCEIQFGTRITKTKDSINEKDDIEKYPVYGGGDITFYTDKYNRESDTLIIGRFGVSPTCVRLIKEKFFLNDSGLSILKYKNIQIKYLQIFLQVNQNLIYKYAEGQGQKNLQTNKFLKEFKIPILSVEHQQRIVDFMDNLIGEDFSKLDKLVSKFKDYNLFELLIYEEYDNFTKLFEYYDELINLEKMYKSFDSNHRKNQLKKCFKTVKTEMKTLGEIAKLSGGIKYKLSKQPCNIGDIIYLRGGDLKENYIDKFDGVYFDYEDEKFNNYKINYGDIYYTLVGTVGICGEYKINKKSVISGNICRIYDININKKYLISYLNLNKPKANSNAQPNISKNTALLIKIPVPSLEDQEKVVKMIEDIEKEDSNFNKMMISLKKMIQCVYDSVEVMVQTNTFNTIDNLESQTNETESNTEETQQDNQEDETNETQEDEKDDEPLIISHKEKQYIVENEIMYLLKSNEKKGKAYGTYINGKVKKYPKQEV